MPNDTPHGRSTGPGADGDVRHDATKLKPRDLYEAIRSDGEAELARPFNALCRSGTAAGILMSPSVPGEAVFRCHLPAGPWRHLVENLGYSFGFIAGIRTGMPPGSDARPAERPTSPRSPTT